MDPKRVGMIGTTLELLTYKITYNFTLLILRKILKRYTVFFVQ